MTYVQIPTSVLCLDVSLKLVNVIYLSLIYRNLSNYLFYKEKIIQETQLEHDAIIKEEVSWEDAVTKVEFVINDICAEYDKDGHPYYSDTLRKYWRRILKG